MAPCSIRWCGNGSHNSSLTKNGITFHRYPKDPNLKEKWISATKRDDWFPSTYSVICSRHFTQDCFLDMKNSRRLLNSAVPTLFLPILTNTDESNSAMPSTSKECIPRSSDKSIRNDNTSTDLDDFDPVMPGTPKQCVPHSSDQSLPNDIISMTPNRKLLKPESPSNYNTTINKRLRRRVIELKEKVMHKNKQLKNLREKTCYLRKKIATLKSINKELEKKNFINSVNVDLLRAGFGDALPEV